MNKMNNKVSIINYDDLLKYYNLKNLVRYNQRVRIKDESVAEHSYYVTLFTKTICSELGVAPEVELDALTYALSHDLPEINLSDIPHPVKAGNPELDTLFNQLEDKVMATEYPAFYDIYKRIQDGKEDIVNTIVVMADILSVIQYATLELRMGNKGATDILSNGLGRYMECKSRLKELTGIEVKSFEL